VPVEIFPLCDVDPIVCCCVLPRFVQANDNKPRNRWNEYLYFFTLLLSVISTLVSMTELNIIGGNHVEIPFYTPLVNDGTKENFWSKDPSVYFTAGNAFSMRSFYGAENQRRLLKYIKKKADNMHHKKLGRLDNVNDLERALTEYYNVAKKSIVRIDEPANDVEWSMIKFLLDTSRFLLLNGLLTVKQYIPIQAESGINSDEKCLVNYLVSTELHNDNIILVLYTISTLEISNHRIKP
jgi:hypothetical protein